jgi:hypothetical protein
MKGWHFTGRLIPMAMFSKDAYTPETNCMLKAVDPERFRENPYWVFAARSAAAGCDNEVLAMEDRLMFKDDLERVMDRLCGQTWRTGTQPAVDDDPEFWLDCWDRARRWSPNDPLFQMFTRDDLIDKINREREYLAKEDADEELAGDEEIPCETTEYVKGYN